MRKNEKETVFHFENSILKSNKISMAKMNHGLSLNQMQLLAFAIYSTQKNGATNFHKADFEKKFSLEQYKTMYIKDDVERLRILGFTMFYEEEDIIDSINVFQRIRYEKGTFIFKWTDDMIPHILELKEKYITTDLTITSQFKSGFSWILYDYLKAHYGYWHKSITKAALMRLFGVEDKKTYINNSALFKKTVLDVAIAEINKFTELDVRYTEEKEGRSIVAFDLIWSNGKSIPSATKKQIAEIKVFVDVVFEDMFKYINLNHQQNREHAIELVKDFESYKEFTKEPICITKEFADTVIQQAKANLRELEQMLEYDRAAPKVPFYNWLEERE